MKKCLLILSPALLLLSSCQGALDPQGPEAARIATVWWQLLGMSTLIFALVLGLLAYALFRRRAAADPHRDRTGFVLLGGLALPAVVLGVVMVITLAALHDLTRAAPEDAPRIEIEARDWWWNVYYPESGVRTANEIHIPVGRPVAITGTALDVIHSFWAPQLNGKFDLIPGKPNEFKIQADRAGVYRGQCAEFCGVSHARMAFFIVAESQQDFDAWLRAQSQPASAPAADSRAGDGRTIFLGSSCASCHGIQGTPADGTVGPDLTHLASRSTFGGGFYELTSANLADWITDPTQLKPGVNMPATQFPADDLDALIAYLMSLE